mgnify:CR=1 FL=1
MGNFFLFLIFYKYLIDKLLYIKRDSYLIKQALTLYLKSTFSIINVVIAEKLFQEQYSLITDDLSRFTL